VATCEVCGNDYDKPIEVSAAGARHTFDCFECAIHMMAPVCEHCGVKIVGHGVEAEGHFYCCASCAASVGVTALRDRVEVAS
jgi:hypothetical protein